MSAVAEPLAASADGVRPESEWPFFFEILDLGELFIDAKYQRPLTNFWKEVRDEFKPAMVGTLVVSKRTKGKNSGKYAVIDGQTRREAMLARELTNAPCLVYFDLTPEEEAQLFSDLQTKRRGMRTYDRFRAQLVAKNPQAVRIARIVESEGFDLNVDETPHTMKAIAGLEKLYKRDGEGDHMRDVLTIIRDAWGTEDREATSAQMLSGISWFLLNQEGVDVNRLVDRLSDVTPSLLKHRASALREGKLPGTGSGMYMGQAILNLYAAKKR